jgi:dihydroxyacetone kinase-like predicted kinase
MLAYNEEDPLQSNLQAMEEALKSVKTIQIATAVRSSRVGGLEISAGQNIALAEDRVVAVGDSPWSVIQEALHKNKVSTGAHLDIFWGANVDERDAMEIAVSLETDFPGEVEVHSGGQPFYKYILSVTE